MRDPLRDRIALATALLAPPVVALALVPVRTLISSANLALILVVVVVAIAALGSRTAGVVAALSAAAWFDFFLTRPYQRFVISDSDDVTTTLFLLAVGVAVSQLAAHARRLKPVTVTDAAHLTRIHDTASLVQSGASPYTVVDQVCRQGGTRRRTSPALDSRRRPAIYGDADASTMAPPSECPTARAGPRTVCSSTSVSHCPYQADRPRRGRTSKLRPGCPGISSTTVDHCAARARAMCR